MVDLFIKSQFSPFPLLPNIGYLLLFLYVNMLDLYIFLGDEFYAVAMERGGG